MADHRDTIFALSSGQPPAAIAVIRISGPRGRFALEALIGRVPHPRQAKLARIRDPQTAEIIDQALALWFPAPASETGEDVAELQLHGGRAVIAAVLAALGRLDGFRMAEPGEFTRRAFENGRLDLTQVEALADLVYAETDAQRRQALAQVTGLLGSHAEAWRRQAIEALALVEAGIDFSDEADVPQTLVARALATVRPLAAEIADALAGAERGERLRDGLWVVIAGPPNAGKSTLLNRIARRDAAIVSPTAGTTRDIIELHLDLGGYPVNLLDTAGIRPASNDAIEREGMRRARAAAGRANLVLWVIDASEADALALAGLKDEPLNPGATRMIVVNKMDLLGEERTTQLKQLLGPELPLPHHTDRAPQHTQHVVHYVSAANGAGLDDLVAALMQFAERTFTLEPALVTRERQRSTLIEVARALEGAIQHATTNAGEEFVAEDLRHAATHLGRLVGRVDVEEILEVIFREFCIGK